MKILKVILFVVGGFILGALTAVAVYFFTVGEVAWQSYVESKLVPNVVIALTSIGTILVAATPIISKVQTTLQNFDKATKDVNDTAEAGKEAQKSIDEQDEKINEINNSLNEQMQKIGSKITDLGNSTLAIERILQIAFCNMDELVKKGYAVEIGKVTQNEDKESED